MRTIWVVLGFGVLFFAVAQTAMAAGSVAVYMNGETAKRVEGLGFTTVAWETAEEVSAEQLAEISVLFVANGAAASLADKAQTIANFVRNGGGLIVEQPNEDGPVALLPAEVWVTVTNYEYPGSHSQADPCRAMCATAAGMAHPLAANLTPDDFTATADTIGRRDFAPTYTVLAVQAQDPDLVGIAVATYGNGRIVFETGNIQPGAFTPGSETFVKRLFTWAGGTANPAATPKGDEQHLQ